MCLLVGKWKAVTQELQAEGVGTAVLLGRQPRQAGRNPPPPEARSSEKGEIREDTEESPES